MNVGTIASEKPVTGQARYVSAKSALVGYTLSLALELTPYNIQANIVIPNMTDTSLLASLQTSIIEKIKDEKFENRLLVPVEVARSIVYLSSSSADSITGQKLIMNQGELPFS